MFKRGVKCIFDGVDCIVKGVECMVQGVECILHAKIHFTPLIYIQSTPIDRYIT